MIEYDVLLTQLIPYSFAFFFANVLLIEIRKFNRENREFKLKQYEIQLYEKENQKSKNNIKDDVDVSVNSSGYFTMEIEEDKKSFFQDLLKGFEEYAKLRGYKVSISIDSSIINKISFKITIHEFGIIGSRESVRNDFNEYINKINNGEPLDDIPIVINELEHFKLITALKNRISFISCNYELQKNIKVFY
jgi:hypothetical protein